MSCRCRPRCAGAYKSVWAAVTRRVCGYAARSVVTARRGHVSATDNALRTAQVTCPGRLAAAGTGRHQTEGHSRRRRLASERLSDAVLRALFERRFPPGFAGLDVFAETAPVETIVSREVLSLVRSTCVRREQDGG